MKNSHMLLLARPAHHRCSPSASLCCNASSGNITVAESLLVASLAGMGNVLLTNPIWMIATRMQTQQRKAKAPPAGAGAAQEGGREGQEGETEDIDLPPPSFLAGGPYGI